MDVLKGKSLLLLEDERLLSRRLAAWLEQKGMEVCCAADLAQARNLLQDMVFDWALLDIHLPDGESLELLQKGLISPNTGVVVMTAEGGVEIAVAAMRAGAGDYLSKPFDPEELPLVFARLERQRQARRLEQFAREQEKNTSQAFFFGPKMKVVHTQLQRILEADRRLGRELPPVLIEGETGTGKSSLARWIHRNGPRSEQPFVEINASALPENLAESELFGHEKGAFTDARSARIGLFEAADGGTLFLDEIASLSPAIQAKLLTAIEDRTIRRVGGNRAIKLDVRLISASLEPLQDLVRRGVFREDLFHRLDLMRLRLPPLREIADDIPLLAEHLLEGLKKRYRLPSASISDEGKRRLAGYRWPGNVRELSHELERSLIFPDQDELGFEHLGEARVTLVAGGGGLLNPQFVVPEEEGFNFEEALQELTEVVIGQALDASDGNVSAAARRLGVPRDFVRYRMKG